MGMNGCNLRLLSKNASISVNKNTYRMRGHGNVSEKELLKYLLTRNVAILERENEQADSGKSYLINEGIEMLIHINENYVSWLELRVCLSWIPEAFRECYEFACVVNEILPLWYWKNNLNGEGLSSEKQFVDDYMALISNKYEIFMKSSFASENVRLTEGEIYEYTKKKNHKVFKFKRDMKRYQKIQI